MEHIADLIEFFADWEPHVQVVGNLRARDAHEALVSLNSRVAELEEENTLLKMQHEADAAAIGQMARKAAKR